jgi:hypothetical protein
MATCEVCGNDYDGIFCCAHCAAEAGERGVMNRSDAGSA